MALSSQAHKASSTSNISERLINDIKRVVSEISSTSPPRKEQVEYPKAGIDLDSEPQSSTPPMETGKSIGKFLYGLGINVSQSTSNGSECTGCEQITDVDGSKDDNQNKRGNDTADRKLSFKRVVELYCVLPRT